MSDEKYKLPSKKSTVIIAALIIITSMLAAAFGIYPMITNRIIDVSLKNFEELAAHDERSIEFNIEDKWETMRGIALHIRQMKCDTTSQLLTMLSANKLLMDCERITLIAENGTTVSSNFVVSTVDESEDLLIYTDEAQYIYMVETRSAATEGHRHILVMGTDIIPFTVEGKRYNHICAVMDINSLRTEMSIEVYGGSGSSSVVDKSGRYIIHGDSDHTAITDENSFVTLDKGRITGSTTENVRERMEKRDTFSLRFENSAGEKLVLCFVPMERAEWYFIMSVPLSVFQKQSASLILIFFLLMTLLFVAFALIVFVVLQRRARTLKLEQKHHKELSDALVLAEQANRAKTVFLNNMSHDIRTPMNAIIGFTELARTHLDQKVNVEDYLEKIARSSDHLLSLINDVLDMSRIECGKMSIKEKPENLLEIINTLKSIVYADVYSKQLDFGVDISGITSEYVYCDKLRLNQMLLNIISNAIKFTPNGGKVSVRITQTEGKTAGTANYEFVVEDSGIGMSAEYKKILFEPFSRERNSTASGIQGTGLGMAITKNIVDMMGGVISVESEENIGTTFTVTLTFRLQEGVTPSEAAVEMNLEDSDTPKSDGGELSPESVTLSGKRLLLAEDNELNREIATELLGDMGLVVESAENGKIVVEMLGASEPGYYSAVLMDIQMPVMDGYEAAKEIRKLDNKALAGIPIIAMTANAFEEDKRAAFEAGMNAHVGKPFDINVLIDTLKRVMAGQTVR